MTLDEKIAVYENVYNNTRSMSFGMQNLVLCQLAQCLGLKHWIGDGMFLLHHPRRVRPLLIVPQ